MSIRDVGRRPHPAGRPRRPTNDAFCIAEQPDGTTTYGAIDAQNGGRVRRRRGRVGQARMPTATPTAVPDATSTRRTSRVSPRRPRSPSTARDGSCLSIEIATDSSSSASVRQSPMQTDSSATDPCDSGGRRANAAFVLVGSTSAKAADQVFLVASGWHLARRRRSCTPSTLRSTASSSRSPSTSRRGTLHIEDVNGNRSLHRSGCSDSELGVVPRALTPGCRRRRSR